MADILQPKQVERFYSIRTRCCVQLSFTYTLWIWLMVLINYAGAQYNFGLWSIAET